MLCLFCDADIPEETLFCTTCEKVKSASILSADREVDKEGSLLKRVIQDRYELLGRIWQDSLGIEFRALYQTKARVDCIRVLPLLLSGNEKNTRQFHESVKSWTSRKIRHILRPIVSGKQAKLHFVISVNMPGLRLNVLLEQGKDIPFPVAIRLFENLCRTIHACHKEGMLHGNIKPSSCFVTRDGNVYVGNMALLNPLPPELFRELVPGDISLYAAPEQLRQEPAAVQSDIYSLSLLGYQLFTGTNPFSTDKEINILYKNLHESVIPPLALDSGIPSPLSDIITRNLGKDPAVRSTTLQEMLEVIRDIGHHQPSGGTVMSDQERYNLRMLINDGREHYARGRFQKSLDCFNNYLRIDSSNFAVQCYRDFAMQRLKLSPDRFA